MKSISPSITLLIIIFAGLILRIYDLDGESLWVDEGHAIQVASFDIDQLIGESARDNHPPLYSLMLHYWMKLFPHTAYYLRLLSVILGALSIFLIYKIGEDLFDKKAGLMSSMFLSFSVFHIQYSQEIRSYMMVVVLILLSFYLLVKLIRTPKIIFFIFLIVVNTLMLYTHFLGWFILFAQNIYYILRFPFNKIRIKHFVIIDSIITILYIPWINIMFARLSDLQVNFWVEKPTLITIPQTLLVYSGTYTFYGIILFFLISILSLMGLFLYRKRKLTIRKSDNHQNYLLLLWMWIPILVPFILSFVMTPVYLFRITIGASLAFYLLAANGFRYIKIKSIKNGIITVVLILSIGTCGIYYTEINKERWKEATEYVELEAQTGDLLIFNAPFGLDKAFNFYAKRNDFKKIPCPLEGLEVNQKLVDEIKPFLKNKDNVWLISSHSTDEENLITKNIETDFDLIQTKEYVSYSYNSHLPYTGIEIREFQRKK